ncbi:hypothetical protein DFQ28_002186 [Apophysomyces sp. BC1034]|nr:hypothetical protein DFQ29_001394 [Apophysomyces sp. BC1021]KAG0190338.1 hypothetical protein DFQ28_002186 [Apophysomyces sp. BC1034]
MDSSLWLSAGLAVTAGCSASVLLSQRLTRRPWYPTGIVVDSERDYSVPFNANGHRFRMLFDTIVLVLNTSGEFYMVLRKENIEGMAMSGTMLASVLALLSWLYALTLVLASRRQRLPSEWGWTINLHLFVLCFVGLCTSIYDTIFYVDTTKITFQEGLPLVLAILMNTDLVYVTATIQRGPPFLCDGKPVIGVGVSSIYGHLCFSWISPLIKAINLDSHAWLPLLPPTYRAFNLLVRLDTYRTKSLLMKLFMVDRAHIIIQILLALVTSSLYYAPAYFVNRLLTFMQSIEKDPMPADRSEGLSLVFGIAAATLLAEVVLCQLMYLVSSSQVRVKSMLDIEIYRKTLRRINAATSDNTKDGANDTASSGTVMNLMSTDTLRISNFISSWFFLVEAPVELAVGVYFLYQLLGKSCLLGFCVMLLSMPMNHLTVKVYSKAQEKLMSVRDKRVALMHEVLLGIRQIKFFGWESRWQERVMEAREVELRHLRVAVMCEVFLYTIWESSPLLVIVVSFWSFTKLENMTLTPAIAFTAITIFKQLQFVLMRLPESIVNLVQALTSVRRIEAYLEEEKEISLTSPAHPDYINSNEEDVNIAFEDAVLTWPGTPTVSESETQANFFLTNVNITFPPNVLSLICGPTGSGKTLMMLSLLGEAVVIRGKATLPRAPAVENPSIIPSEHWIQSRAVSYVSQTAWLQNASIRDNILFDLPYVEKRYKDTLFSCALNKDLAIFEDGDMTEIGERGITLSGGQKARVALARAVYSRAQNVLMDDVLSAVDAHTAKHLYEHCLMGPLMQNRTRILITHHVGLCLHGSDFLVHINHETVHASGSPTELRQSGVLASILTEIKQHTNIDDEENTPTDDFLATEKTPKALIEEEEQETGQVKSKFYLTYLRMVGSLFFWLVIAFIVLSSRGLDIFVTWWLKKWTQASLDKNNSEQLNFYLGVYVAASVMNVAIGQARFAGIFWGGLRASRELYEKLVERILRAPFRWFHITPVGRILNRLSKDFESIDLDIPARMMGFTMLTVQLIASVVTVAFVLPVFAIPMTIITVVNIIAGRKFIGASRELKRADSVTRSPIFSHYTETLAGITTIRAFGATSRFMKTMLRHIDMNAKPYYYIWIVDRWISIRFSSMGASVCLLTGIIILFNLDSLDAATAGFCLSFVLVYTQQMFTTIKWYTQLEMNLNAVERVVEFMDIDQAAPAVTSVKPPLGWPSKGQIEVQDLEVRYAPDLQPVLKNLTFSIRAREKVGVVGRTGSGKSTLALSLFRFLEASRGSIIIDGVNIGDIGTYDLRSNLTIIPQDPTLFSGTLRSNMDPFNQFNDTDIFAALRRVHLIQTAGMEETNVFSDLDTSVSEGGQNFSQGQRQLLCLARALLKRANVVLMDEATASVDFETDKTIQRTIATEFADCTILCIAHRLHTVIEYDRILVLDQGEIKEFASPWQLLGDSESLFHKMCQNSGEFTQLATLAKAKHQLVDVM